MRERERERESLSQKVKLPNENYIDWCVHVMYM